MQHGGVRHGVPAGPPAFPRPTAMQLRMFEAAWLEHVRQLQLGKPAAAAILSEVRQVSGHSGVVGVRKLRPATTTDVCVCVCVCVRERERERGKAGAHLLGPATTASSVTSAPTRHHRLHAERCMQSIIMVNTCNHR
jgi:hypothetical protein